MDLEPRDYLAALGDPDTAGKTAQNMPTPEVELNQLRFYPRDYRAALGDPGTAGKTAQERRALGFALWFLFHPSLSKLSRVKTKNPTAFAVRLFSLVARPGIEPGTS